MSDALRGLRSADRDIGSGVQASRRAGRLTNVWRDTTVTDNALVQCVIELRKAIGDEARPPRSIRTIPRVGYQLIGAVEEVNESIQAMSELPAIDPEPAGNAPQTS